jgi:hypothetical protein
MKRNYSDLIRSAKAKWGHKFSDRGLADKFIPYYESGQRIEVDFSYGTIKRGTVGVSTGWVPVFLLILRKDSTGSAWTLSSKDKIVKVIK